MTTVQRRNSSTNTASESSPLSQSAVEDGSNEVPEPGPWEGSRLGLILGAGGIRGCAHSGVLSVLEEADVSADVVAGASIGAIFGAAYAAGWSSDRIATLTEFAPRHAVAEFYLNRLRIDRSTYIGRTIQQLGVDTRIEELPKRFACTALDCASGEITVLTEGPLLTALQASIALPGIARPVVINGSSYLDGGLRGPMPSAVVRSLGADRVIRVELVGGRQNQRLLRRRYRSIFGRALGWQGGRHREPHSPSASPSDLHASSARDGELIITPDFYGLFCNSPLGVRFCTNRGKIATRYHLSDLRKGLAIP